MKMHYLSEVDKDTRKALCAVCGPVSVRYGGKSKNGFDRWKCCIKVKHNKKPWLKFKKETCEKCGFVPEHQSQLDVDHIDGNPNNNDPKNLQTLCANCHRLKTYLNKDWIKDKPTLFDPLEP